MLNKIDLELVIYVKSYCEELVVDSVNTVDIQQLNFRCTGRGIAPRAVDQIYVSWVVSTWLIVY